MNTLNKALATEVVCALRHKSHCFRADGINASGVAREFVEHADDMAGLLDGMDS